MSDADSESKAVARLSGAIEAGSDLVGASAGAALGIFGGPPGVIGGAMAGVVITRSLRSVGSALVERFTGPREQLRIGGAIAVAAEDIGARLDEGMTPRPDWDGEVGDPPRTDVDEILEGVLRHAADAYQERKVPYLGHFYAHVAFDESYAAAEVHLLLNPFERITYRGLVLMALLAEPSYEDQLGDAEMRRIASGVMQPQTVTFMLAVAELNALGGADLIGVGQSDGKQVANYASVLGGGSFASFTEKARLMPLGRRLHEGFELWRAPAADREEVLLDLAGRPEDS